MLSELGPAIKAARGAKGIRAAAAEIGISPTTFSKVERGHLPDMRSLEKVCAWAGVELALVPSRNGALATALEEGNQSKG